MNWYLSWVSANPLLSAAVQFGILGPLGELISVLVSKRKISDLGRPWQIGAKILAWALLGVIIKYGFAGMKGFVDALIDKGLLPRAGHGTLAWALMVSVFTNILFGPQMMAFHRVEDNLILGHKGFNGIQKAWLTLLWFWIPAHTVTFILPSDFQIGLASLWSVALGVIMGLTSVKK